MRYCPARLKQTGRTDQHEQVYVDLVPDPGLHALDNFASRLSQSEGVTETLTVILASAVCTALRSSTTALRVSRVTTASSK